MSNGTLSTEAVAEAYAQALEDFTAGREDIVATYVHEDGSRTYIVRDESYDHDSPRDDEGNVATLILDDSDRRWMPLDEDTAGLAEARDSFANYGLRGTTAPRWGRQSRTHDRSDMMRRYVAMFRPDIAHYVPEWEVSGYVQGDWQGGWGYVTREALERNGLTDDYMAAHDMSAEKCFQQERATYELHFRGDYYGAVHVEMGEAVVSADFTGAELVSVELEEESVWGFLGYDDLRDIAGEMTDSPIVGEE